MSGDSESQAHIHAAGVALDGSVEKFLNPCKIDNLIKLLRDLRAFHAQDRSVQENVLSAGQFRMKSCTNLKQAPHPAIQFDLPLSRMRNQREDLEQGRFATAVAPDNPQHIPWHHLEGDIA